MLLTKPIGEFCKDMNYEVPFDYVPNAATVDMYYNPAQCVDNISGRSLPKLIKLLMFSLRF